VQDEDVLAWHRRQSGAVAYGWYNSAEARLVKSPDTDEMPPAMRTRPSSSGVAVKSSGRTACLQPGLKVPVAGSYSSVASVISPPPAMRTRAVR